MRTPDAEPLYAGSFPGCQEPRDVSVDIGLWIDQGITNAGLGCEMHDGLDGIIGKRRREARHGRPGPLLER